MSIHVNYGPIKLTLEGDAEGYAFSCPLCHNVFFSHGDKEACQKLTQEHMHQFHKVHLPASDITEDNTEAPKIQLRKAS